MLCSSSNLFFYLRSTQLKSSEPETISGTASWKETIQSNNLPETLVKFHIWTESFQEHKSPPEFLIWMMPTCQELPQNGSGTRKLQLLLGVLSTTSSTCAITTDHIREPHWENTHSQMFILSLDRDLNCGLFWT